MTTSEEEASNEDVVEYPMPSTLDPLSISDEEADVSEIDPDKMGTDGVLYKAG